MKVKYVLLRVSLRKALFWRRNPAQVVQADPWDLRELDTPIKVATRHTHLNATLRLNDHISFLRKMTDFDLTDPRATQTTNMIVSRITSLLEAEIFKISRYSGGFDQAFDAKLIADWVQKELNRLEANKDLPKIGELASTLHDLKVTDAQLWRLLERAVVEDKFADSASEIVNCWYGFSFFPHVFNSSGNREQCNELAPYTKGENQLRLAITSAALCPKTQQRLAKIYHKLLPHTESIIHYQNANNIFRILKGVFLCPRMSSAILPKILSRLSSCMGEDTDLEAAFETFKLLEDMGALDAELGHRFERILIDHTHTGGFLNRLLFKPFINSPARIATMAWYIARREAYFPALPDTKSFLIKAIKKSGPKFSDQERFLALEAIKGLSASNDEEEKICSYINAPVGADKAKILSPSVSQHPSFSIKTSSTLTPVLSYISHKIRDKPAS